VLHRSQSLPNVAAAATLAQRLTLANVFPSSMMQVLTFALTPLPIRTE